MAEINTWPKIYTGLEKVPSSHLVQVDSPSEQETFICACLMSKYKLPTFNSMLQQVSLNMKERVLI